MRRRAAWVFVFVTGLLTTLPASLIAIERDRSFEVLPGWSRNRSSSSARVSGDESKAIAKLIRDINAAAQKDKRRILSIIVINTNVAATTLEQQKTRSRLTLGDIYVAHALSLATRKKFDSIMALKTGGQSWAEIARAHNVSLKGSTELLKEMMKSS